MPNTTRLDLVRLQELKTIILALDPKIELFEQIEKKSSSPYKFLQLLDYLHCELTMCIKEVAYPIKFSGLDLLHKLSEIKVFDVAKKRVDKINNHTNFPKIGLNRRNKDQNIDIFFLKDIIRCQSRKNYTHFFIIGESRPVIIPKTLGIYERTLCSYNFVRIHQSHVINLDHVKSYTDSKNIRVFMTDTKDTIPVSRKYKSEFRRVFKD